MKKLVNKSVNLDLAGIDGNAYSIMGMFSREAKKQGWNQEEIDLVLEECKKGDYNELLSTILLYCEPNDDSESYKSSENENPE